MKHWSIVIIILVLVAKTSAQDGEGSSWNSNHVFPRTNIRASCTIPKIVANQAFRNSLSGVYDANASFNIHLFRNFNVGVGYKNALFVVNKDAYKLRPFVSTRMQTHDGFLRIGYDKTFKEKRGFYSFAVNVGYSYNKYTAVSHTHDTLAGKYPQEFGAVFFRPEIGLNFLVEENFAFGIVVAYNCTLSTFDPRYPAFNEYDDYSKYKNTSNMGYISFGFDFYIGLKRKK